MVADRSWHGFLVCPGSRAVGSEPMCPGLSHGYDTRPARNHAGPLAMFEAFRAHPGEHGEPASPHVDMLTSDRNIAIVWPGRRGVERRRRTVAPVDFPAHMVDVTPCAGAVSADLACDGAAHLRRLKVEKYGLLSRTPGVGDDRPRGRDGGDWDVLLMVATLLPHVQRPRSESADHEEERKTTHDASLATHDATSPKQRKPAQTAISQ